jgi:hypothetical protein
MQSLIAIDITAIRHRTSAQEQQRNADARGSFACGVDSHLSECPLPTCDDVLDLRPTNPKLSTNFRLR